MRVLHCDCHWCEVEGWADLRIVFGHDYMRLCCVSSMVCTFLLWLSRRVPVAVRLGLHLRFCSPSHPLLFLVTSSSGASKLWLPKRNIIAIVLFKFDSFYSVQAAVLQTLAYHVEAIVHRRVSIERHMHYGLCLLFIWCENYVDGSGAIMALRQICRHLAVPPKI